MPIVESWAEFYATRGVRTRPLVVAHRGVPVLRPENTLASFELALEQGADVLETDLRITYDGEIVLFHDSTVDRMTDSLGLVGEMSLTQIKKLRTRTPAGALSHHPVPTLVELLEMTRGEIPLLLELKDRRFAEPEMAHKLVTMLAEHNVLPRASVVSFRPELVASVRAVDPGLPVGHITLNNPVPRSGMPLLGPFWPLLFMNPMYVWMAHRQGSIVAPLDPTPETRMGYYLQLGVDAVLADYPARVLRVMAEHGAHF